jgi:4-amino-4-deoxychorismate lyase
VSGPEGTEREIVIRVNGAAAQSVSALDRGLQFGDGLFETIACVRHRPRFLSLHLDRLAQGCRRLQIQPVDLEQLRAQVRELARSVDRCIVKLLVSRGTAITRGYAPAGDERATYITVRYPWPHEDAATSQDGVTVRTLSLRLGENRLLAGLKHCNRLEQVLARVECAQRDVAEGLLFSQSGYLVSGTMSNVFLVRSASLLTPRVDLCGVAGVMRRVVLSEAQRVGIPVQECLLSAQDLENADEIFLTNARVGIWPVRAIDGRTLSSGLITRRLQDALAPMLDEPEDEALDRSLGGG